MSQETSPIFGSDDQIGKRAHKLMERLFPICRSITGAGLRETLKIIGESVPLEISEVPTGTKCYDWAVPREWNIRDAYVIDPSGNKIINFKANNLHVVGYSVPVDAKLPLEELKKHLHTLPSQPDAIPYKTTYYEENWGFCLSHEQFCKLVPGEYTAVINSTLENGAVTYAELLIPGKKQTEFVVSTYVCHPSMCNDNLSGIVIAMALAEQLMQRENEYSYRFLFVPETIGSIVWLSRNEDHLEKIKFGLSINSLGDPGPLTYKKSRRGNAPIDEAAALALGNSDHQHQIVEFVPTGSDERQYCSPGFNLPIGALTRTEYDFAEYHSSADDLDFVRPRQLQASFQAALSIIDVVEGNKRFMNTNPKAEPQLGRRGIYATLGGSRPGEDSIIPILWVLNLSDGDHTLADIAKRSGLAFEAIQNTANTLAGLQLLRELDPVYRDTQ